MEQNITAALFCQLKMATIVIFLKVELTPLLIKYCWMILKLTMLIHKWEWTVHIDTVIAVTRDYRAVQRAHPFPQQIQN